MNSDLNSELNLDTKITEFIKKSHILTLCVCDEFAPYACSCFYAYENGSFFIASDENTTHIKIARENSVVAINIALDTKIIGLIKGVQAKGVIKEANNKSVYFKRFPYALPLNPKIWEIEIFWLKFTDNALSKKLIYEKK